MSKYGIDLVVHGFANEEDERKQDEFFAIAKRLGKFRRIGYCRETSTTDLLAKIQSLSLSAPSSSVEVSSSSKNTVTNSLSRSSENCVHNHRQEQDNRFKRSMDNDSSNNDRKDSASEYKASICPSNSSMPSPTADIISRPRKTIYTDGIFDLFHIGHLRAITQCAQLGDKVIIGVTSDLDAASYKRPPIISEQHRIEILSSLRYVNQVICPCPLVVTEEFMSKYGIDLVVHGFANEEDERKQDEFFAIAKRLGKFRRIGYCRETSTTELLSRIHSDSQEN